jgi:hypothetical protein
MRLFYSQFHSYGEIYMRSDFKKRVLEIVKLTPFCLCLVMSIGAEVFAQEVVPTPPTPTEAGSLSDTGTSQQLNNLIPASNSNFEQLNGIQQQINNGITSPLQPTNCRTNSCLQLFVRQTQQGTEILGGIQIGFGGSSDETYANAAMYRAETERQQALASHRLLLLKELRSVTNERTYGEIVLKELKN